MPRKSRKFEICEPKFRKTERFAKAKTKFRMRIQGIFPSRESDFGSFCFQLFSAHMSIHRLHGPSIEELGLCPHRTNFVEFWFIPWFVRNWLIMSAFARGMCARAPRALRWCMEFPENGNFQIHFIASPCRFSMKRAGWCPTISMRGHLVLKVIFIEF